MSSQSLASIASRCKRFKLNQLGCARTTNCRVTYRLADDRACALPGRVGTARLTAASVLVAFSRVEDRSLLRIAPCDSNALARDLQGLEHSRDLLAWDAIYDSHGYWRQNNIQIATKWAREAYDELMAVSPAELQKYNWPN